jgi:multicomponent Na+:H+ antiporter subunit E
MLKAVVLRGLLFATVWWVLSEGRLDSYLLGSIAIIAATWVSFKLVPRSDWRFRVMGLCSFIGFFLWHSLRGGLQVSLLAFRGKAALQPAMIELPLTLKAEVPRLLLVNSLGLMPGTLSYDLDEQCVRLHVLDERQDIAKEVLALEKSIAAIFGGIS